MPSLAIDALGHASFFITLSLYNLILQWLQIGAVEELFSQIGGSGLILYITVKFLYKIKQAFKQAKQADCLTYQAKQASFRCEKFQASKLRLSGLAYLLNSKSSHIVVDFGQRL